MAKKETMQQQVSRLEKELAASSLALAQEKEKHEATTEEYVELNQIRHDLLDKNQRLQRRYDFLADLVRKEEQTRAALNAELTNAKEQILDLLEQD
jgi:chromosome segregation ATPase